MPILLHHVSLFFKGPYLLLIYLFTAVVFGFPKGPLVDLKIQNTHSVTVPYLHKIALARNQAGYFGQGLNRCSATHVEESMFIIFKCNLNPCRTS